jgi:hypothetical protein
MWAVRCRDAYAPLQRFESDLSLRRVLRHALTIWPERFSVNATNLRSMLRTFSSLVKVWILIKGARCNGTGTHISMSAVFPKFTRLIHRRTESHPRLQP